MFVAHYYVQYDLIENDCQPDMLHGEDIVVNQNNSGLPSTIPLMSSSETLKCRVLRQVLRYHVPNRELKPENHAHYLLFLFYPFRNENDLMSDNNSYCEKLLETGVMNVINRNIIFSEPAANEIDAAFVRLSQENGESNRNLVCEFPTSSEDNGYQEPNSFDQSNNGAVETHRTITLLSDSEIGNKIVSLKGKRSFGKFFFFFFSKARKYGEEIKINKKLIALRFPRIPYICSEKIETFFVGV